MNNKFEYSDRVIFPTKEKEVKSVPYELISYLDKNLKKSNAVLDKKNMPEYDGWIIFIRPDMACSVPEIVFFNPFCGLIFIETANYSKFQTGKYDITFTDNGTNTGLKTYIQKLHHYRSKLISVLVPSFGEYIFENKKQSIVSGILYLPNINQESVKNFISDRKDIKEYISVFGKDTAGPLAIINSAVSMEKSKNEIKKFSQEILFSLYPNSLKNTYIKNIKLTTKQAKLIEPTPGHHRVRGFAGSGKTQILAFRAIKLASENKKVLIICFNITLIHFINKLLREIPAASGVRDNISVNYFHGFCKDILIDNHKSMPISINNTPESKEVYFMKTVPEAVLNAVRGKEIKKYDAILIDEGQDYYPEWYQMLCNFLSERDELVIMCDKKQNVFGRDFAWIDKRKQGMEKFGEWHELKTVFRMPKDISEVADRFSRRFNPNNDSEVPENAYQKNLIGRNIEWTNISSQERNEKLHEKVIELLAGGANSKDITVLIPTHDSGINAAEHLKAKGLSIMHVFSAKNKYGSRSNELKKTFNPEDSRIKMSTVHSFKGWECGNIILCIPETDFSKNNRQISDSLIYTAMTRTERNLIVLNANPRYYEFGMEINEEYSGTTPEITTTPVITNAPVQQKDDILGEINSLTGLTTLKRQIKEMHSKITFEKLRRVKNLGGEKSKPVNLLFTGNPGTGKTTVAKMLGQVFRKMGILTSGHVIEADRSVLVGKFVGHTAPKVMEVIEQARGGILFIDEAYSLARNAEDKIDYGAEAIEILLKEMTTGKGNLVIIAAGYKDKMEIFLNSNPGLKSRFTYIIQFDDYSPEELLEIAINKAKKENYIITDSACMKLLKLFRYACKNKDVNFGNARYAQTVFESSVTKLASRILSEGNTLNINSEELMLIKDVDIEDIPEPAKENKEKIKFGFQ